MGQEFSSESADDVISDLEHRTKFSHDELRIWYDRFYEDFPDGHISSSGFVRMYKNMYKQGDATAFAKHIFRAFDTDGSGTIDFREFMCTLSVTQRGTLDERLHWAFSMYDINGDGKISREEAIDIITAIYQMKGKEDAEREAEERALELFIAMDKNHDDELSQTEFCTGAKQCKAFIKLIKET